MASTLRALACAALLLTVPALAAAEERPAQADAGAQRGAERGAGILRLLPPDSVTEHVAETAAGRLAYTATAGTLSLYDGSGERSAAVFYTAYAAKDANPAGRPVTFVFNGGPGAASAYLHLGVVGPKVLALGPNFDAAAARLEDNPLTWLAFTDLVMIDPVGTGWSRAAKPDGGSAFWGVEKDASSVAKVIALYVAKNGRSASPKYLLGESYGGFRAAKVARALQKEQGIIASGLVLLSPFLEAALQFGGDRYALGAALKLPVIAAGELERTGRFSPEAMAEIERFARTEYLTALAGPAPQGEAANALYAKLTLMTGVPAETLARSRGFLTRSVLDEARSARGKALSRYDVGFAVDDPFPDLDAHLGDPILDGYTRALGGAFVGYARDHLGYRSEMTYALLSNEVNGKWDWKEGSGRLSQPSAMDDLRALLALNPSFRIHIAHGYADLATPYTVSRYVVDHLPPIGAPGRVSMNLYRGGHMFYFDAATLAAYTRDIAAFYAGDPRAKDSRPRD